MKVDFKVLGGASHTADVQADATVKSVKNQVAPALSVDSATAILVHKGKLLKDDDTLSSAKIVEGSVVHVVSRKAAQEPAAAPPASAPSAVPPAGNSAANPMANLFAGMPGGLGGLGGLPQMPQGMPNPEMVAKMMQDPQMQQMMQSVLSNPQIMMDMLRNNPMLQNLANSNPMFRDTMQNPEMLRNMFSPEAMQSAMSMMSSLGGAGGAGGLDLSSLSSLLGGAQQGADPTDNRPAAEKYKDQAQLLKDMGFLEEEANIRALQFANGNLDDAISKLLADGHGN